jgi:hypothetical protein
MMMSGIAFAVLWLYGGHAARAQAAVSVGVPISELQREYAALHSHFGITSGLRSHDLLTEFCAPRYVCGTLTTLAKF